MASSQWQDYEGLSSVKVSMQRHSDCPSCPLTVAGVYVNPISVVRVLGVYSDNDLNDAVTDVWRTVSRCFAALVV